MLAALGMEQYINGPSKFVVEPSLGQSLEHTFFTLLGHILGESDPVVEHLLPFSRGFKVRSGAQNEQKSSVLLR